jgi:hypothetical protein
LTYTGISDIKYKIGKNQKNVKNAFFDFLRGSKGEVHTAMDDVKNKSKLSELIAGGYELTGRTYKVLMGVNKGREFPVYAQRGDIAGLVYNDVEDKIELVFKLSIPFTGKPSRTSAILKEIKKIHTNPEQRL